MDGILLVDKPLNWTSFDVVAKVRGIAKKQTQQKIKVGHSGTLDPLASGLLVLVIGSYTKKASDYVGLDKDYQFTMRLGQTSSTADNEGNKKLVSDYQPSLEEIEVVILSYQGEIEQTPPIYSAIKIDGQRAYKLAREGKIPDIKPRKVKISSLELVSYKYPDVSLSASVSSGTFIRSLAEDIGKDLGVGAYTTSLRRSRVGKFQIDDAIEIEQLNETPLSQLIIIG